MPPSCPHPCPGDWSARGAGTSPLGLWGMLQEPAGGTGADAAGVRGLDAGIERLYRGQDVPQFGCCGRVWGLILKRSDLRRGDGSASAVEVSVVSVSIAVFTASIFVLSTETIAISLFCPSRISSAHLGTRG